MPTVRPESPPSLSKFQCSGGSCSQTSGNRFSNASIAPSTNSEIGIALAPRGARDDPPLEELGRDLVHAGAAHLHPRHALGVLEAVRRPTAEQHVGGQVGGRRLGPDVDHLRVGHRGPDPVADPVPELVQDRDHCYFLCSMPLGIVMPTCCMCWPRMLSKFSTTPSTSQPPSRHMNPICFGVW